MPDLKNLSGRGFTPRNGFLALLIVASFFCSIGKGDEARITNQGGSFRDWEIVSQVQRSDGSVAQITNSYTEIRTGLNHKDQQGNWIESKELIELAPHGASAKQGPYQVDFPANLRHAKGVRIKAAGGEIFAGVPIALAYFDTASRKSVTLAELKDTEGDLYEPKTVIYSHAFNGGAVDASVRFTYSLANFSQDILIHSQLPPPEDYQMNPETTLFQVITEVVEAPSPELERDDFPAESPAIGNLQHHKIKFKEISFVKGGAFSTDGLQSRHPESSSISVSEQWIESSKRRFLIESVEYATVAPQLEELPVAKSSGKERKFELAKIGSEFASLPTPDKEAPLKVAKLDPSKQKFFVIDYDTIPTSSVTNYVFRADKTTYVSGKVNLYGFSTTLEGGAIIKFAADDGSTGVGFVVFDDLICTGQPYFPSILTAVDDRTCGETITGSGTSPSGFYPAAAITYDASSVVGTLAYVRISHAKKAIISQGGKGRTFSNIQIVNTSTAFTATNGHHILRNVLVHGADVAFDGKNYTNRCEHFTLHVVNTNKHETVTGTSFVFMTNSLLISVTNAGTAGGNLTSCASVSSDSGIFDSVGAGYHYLPSASPYLASGTTTINAGLLSSFKRKTVFAPVLISGVSQQDLTLGPTVARDNGGAPALGYHYDVCDYASDTLTMTNATLVITNGAVLCSRGTTAVWIRNNAKLYCEGSPTNYNIFTRHYSIQEQTYNWGFSDISHAYSIFAHATANNGTGYVRFTKSFVQQGGGYHFDLGFAAHWFSTLEVKDSAFYGASAVMQNNAGVVSTYKFNNNLFQRVYTTINQDTTFDFYNNLVYQGTFDFTGGTTYTMTFKDNAFDSCTLNDNSGNATHGYNAYINSSGRFTPTNANDVVLTSFTYGSSSFGDYYQISSDLVDKGSRTASAASLYHYTTDDSAKDSGTVDIGLHYIFLTSFKPNDADNDGVPDYLEDQNSNGNVDAGETDWQDATDLGFKVFITEPKNGQNLP